MFSTGVYLRIWGVSDKGKFTEVDCSTSKKNRQTDQYETDFSSKFVKFLGNAHNKRPQPNERIKITSCGVQNVVEKDGQRQYLKNPTYLVFDFERDNEMGQPIVGVPPMDSYTPSAYGGIDNGFAPMDIPEDTSLPF
jgi:hypothetical protein